MTKKIKIKNVSKERQAVAWIPAFEAWDVQELDAEQAELLLHNVAFQAIETTATKPMKTKTT